MCVCVWTQLVLSTVQEYYLFLEGKLCNRYHACQSKYSFEFDKKFKECPHMSNPLFIEGFTRSTKSSKLVFMHVREDIQFG